MRSANIRDVNRKLGWHLPCDAPRPSTAWSPRRWRASPTAACAWRFGPYRLEILQAEGNRVTRLRAWQTGKPAEAQDDASTA